MPLLAVPLPSLGSGGGSTGIGVEVTAGVVPEYECREAAVYACMPWPMFSELPSPEKALIVAHFRLHRAIEQHQLAAARPPDTGRPR